MFDLIFAHPIPFILAVIIGIATGWWIWATGETGTTASADEGETFTPPAAAQPAPAPAPEPTPEPVTESLAGAGVAAAAGASGDGPRIAAAVGEDDDLTKINGIGPKLCALCNDLGVRRFDQIAAWGDNDIAEVDAHLGSFKGRISRDNWVEQAKLLAAGDEEGWKARFGYKSK